LQNLPFDYRLNKIVVIQFEFAEVVRPFLLWPGNESRLNTGKVPRMIPS